MTIQCEYRSNCVDRACMCKSVFGAPKYYTSWFVHLNNMLQQQNSTYTQHSIHNPRPNTHILEHRHIDVCAYATTKSDSTVPPVYTPIHTYKLRKSFCEIHISTRCCHAFYTQFQLKCYFRCCRCCCCCYWLFILPFAFVGCEHWTACHEKYTWRQHRCVCGT